MNKIITWFLITTISLIALYFRFSNLGENHFEPDVGYELEVARIINRDKRLPLIGPALGLDGFNIPPTYLYLISFFYFLNSDTQFIFQAYALMGFLTTVFLTLFIHSLTNSKKISIIFFYIFSIWNYLLILSRSIWHPHPVFLFLSLFLLFSSLALKTKNIFYLFFSQLLFFISLSIYPSPILFFPVLFIYSFLFFTKNKKLKKSKSIFYSLISIFSFWFIVYLPQIVFEFQNNFSSLQSIFRLASGESSFIGSFFNNIKHGLKVYFSIFFPIKSDFKTLPSLFSQVLFLLFHVFLFLNILRNDKKDFLIKPFINPLFLIWVFLIIGLMDNVYAGPLFPHRIDVISIVLFIALAKNIEFIKNFKFVKKILFLFPIVIFLLLFTFVNIKDSLNTLKYEDVQSLSFSKKASELIISKIMDKKISRDQVIILNNIQNSYELKSSKEVGEDIIVSSINERGLLELKDDPDSYFWFSRWQAERIDHLVNKTFVEESPLVSSYKNTFDFDGVGVDRLNKDYFFLICRQHEGDKCIDNFHNNLVLLYKHSDLQPSFFIEDYLVVDDENLLLFFIKNTTKK